MNCDVNGREAPRRRRFRRAILCLASATLALSTRHTVGAASPTAVLWRDPGPVEDRDLFWGAGSAQRAPVPPFTFRKEDASGTKPKIHVVDGRGRTWSVKFDRRSGRGREVPAEIAASRIAWALGYPVEESYLVTDGVIENLGDLKRGGALLRNGGRFETARFEARPDEIDRLSTRWTVADNPFAGTKALSGLLLLNALLNNWDFRAGNTTVLRVDDEERYIVSDWGTAFGRMPPGRSRWNLDDYRKHPDFVRPTPDGSLELNLQPDDGPSASVSLEHARWFATLAGRLTRDQIRRAFDAAGATPDEVDGFASAVRARLDQLQTMVAPSSSDPRTP